MSHNPPYGPPPPYYTGQGHPPPPPPGGFAYVPAPVMMPVYQPPPPPPPPEVTAPPTFVTNYIYQQPPQPQPVIVEDIEWVPATTGDVGSLSHKAFVAGREAWDGSPLCVIRAHHSGEFLPGKLAIKHRAAYVPYGGREVPVHNFEVLCVPSHAVRWLHSSNGQVPVGAIAAGNTHSGEPLYIGRVRHMQSLTPGKVHPSHGCCYISFAGSEHTHKTYEVLCRIVG
ncbi:uncharacterized protein LOC124634494 isoform X3 [Helicoverpa zea]|uniref:uncharacterized protein LOC124634494 isoform X3 n=1 Tax=Helicoverpa zea TaxID=7113 RepID=UPI001F56EA37|nr:uncharacterized protein LOC124634494 isoform X3 [Helicoverpa zea]